MKKILAVICAASLISAAFTPVFAENEDSINTTDITGSKRPSVDKLQTARIFDSQGVDDSLLLSSVAETEEVEVQDWGDPNNVVTADLIEYFRNATENFAEEIYVRDFNLKYDLEDNDKSGEQDFQELYEMLIYSSPRSYYLISENGTYEFFYPEVDAEGYIEYIYPIYTFFDTENSELYDSDLWIDTDKLPAVEAEVAKIQNDFDEEVAKIQGLVREGDSDFKKLLTYHDYIVMNYSYDWDDYNKPVSERTSNTIANLIENKKGLCESMSIMFNYLAMEDGIETGYVTSYNTDSNTAYHTWSLVCISAPDAKENEDCWYNVDVTWDENMQYQETSDKEHIKNEGRTSYKYFLLSDDETYKTHASSIEHVDYEKSHLTETPNLDNVVWRSSAESQIVEYGNARYYVSTMNGETSICKYDLSTLRTDKVYTFPKSWSYDNSTSYSGLVLRDDVLYFNGAKKLYVHDISKNKTESEDISGKLGDSEIYACYDNGSMIRYCTATLNNGTLSKIKDTGEFTLQASGDITVVQAPAYNDGRVTVTLKATAPAKAMFFVKDGETIKGSVVDVAEEEKTYEITDVVSAPEKIFLWDIDMKPLQ